MASKLTKVPLLRVVSARAYSQAVPVSGTQNYELKTTVLSNKLVVTSADNQSSIARISIVFRAGSRNENSDNLGVTHVLRTAAGLSTKNATQFAIMRNIQQVGASLTATSDREIIAYTLEGTKQAIERALPFLTEVATQQEFRPWEVADLSSRLQLDIATRSLQLRAVDLLHNAAFRTGLGNSLFIPKTKIGKISSETLQHYVASNFLSDRAAVVGLGISHNELTQYAQKLKIRSGAGTCNPSPYKGGELRSNKGGDLAFVAVAGEGAPLTNPKEAVAFAILQGAISSGPQLKWSQRDNGVLTKTIGNVADYTSAAINVSYSDTGLFGVLLATPAKSACKVVEGAVNALKGSISDADVARGKNQLKARILLENESGSNAVLNYGNEAVLTGEVHSPIEWANAVDNVSTSEVQDALKKVGNKLTFASIGNLSNVPYADDLN